MSKVFKVFNKVAAVVTVTNIDPSIHFMKQRVTNAFQSGQLSVLQLNSKKRGALIDFISVLPEMATKAATRDNIIDGFVETGLIDKKQLKYPVLEKILATCKKSIPRDIYDKFIDNFPRLFSIMLEKGHISEEVYDDMDFPRDMDVHGREVRRDATISQESQQRCKELTHTFQIDERRERTEAILAEQRRRKDLEKHLMIHLCTRKVICQRIRERWRQRSRLLMMALIIRR